MFNMFGGLGNATAPLTLMGRVISVVAMVIGLVMLALILQAVTETMAFTTSEVVTHVIMMRSRHRLRLYSTAAELIEATWIRHKAKKDLLAAYTKTHKTQSRALGAITNTAQFLVTGTLEFKSGTANSHFCDMLNQFVKERWEGTKVNAQTEAQVLSVRFPFE
jgi:hypothetical protein